jgi:hypothetical protein
MLFREKIAAYSENHAEHTDTLCGYNVEFQYVKVDGTYSNHWALKDWCPEACLENKLLLFFESRMSFLVFKY